MFPTQSDINILDLFEKNDLVKICAPMVRYSKVQFRNLVKTYNCDLCFTPMILADSFCQSQLARSNEFTTNSYDQPLVVQFAAKTVYDFVGASYLVSPFCNGVDLNCGCPQRWARQQGVGCVMLNSPELIFDIVRQCRNRISKPFTISVKMRLLTDTKKSVNLCKQLEHCGVSFLTVHARTAAQLTGEVNTEALRDVTDGVSLPIVANGGCRSLDDCLRLQKATNCKGVMVANGLLTNPAVFTGSKITTLDCIQNWLDICWNSTGSEFRLEKPKNLTFQCFHHHLVFMLEKLLSRSEKRTFNNLQSFKPVLEFLKTRFNISPCNFDKQLSINRKICDLNYEDRIKVYNELRPDLVNCKKSNLLSYNESNTDGAFFTSKVAEDGCDWSNIFDEQL